MARRQPIPIRRALRKLFPATSLTALACDRGAVQRRRKVDPVEQFWSIVLGFGVGRARSIAGLRRAHEESTSQQIEESSVYDRFTPALTAMLKRAVAVAINQALCLGRELRGPLAAFRDAVLTDSTVVRLHGLLAAAYPGSRTNHSKAALKAHVIISDRATGKQSIKLTAERAHDGPVFRVGKWVKGRLLLFDLGYFRYQLFGCITRNGGYLLSRLKGHADPTIVAVNRHHRGRAVKLVSAKVRDVVARLRREVLDVLVEVRFDATRAGRAEALSGCASSACATRRAASTTSYVANIPPEKRRRGRRRDRRAALAGRALVQGTQASLPPRRPAEQ